MKKLVSFALTAVLCLSMTTTVFAAKGDSVAVDNDTIVSDSVVNDSVSVDNDTTGSGSTTTDKDTVVNGGAATGNDSASVNNGTTDNNGTTGNGGSSDGKDSASNNNSSSKLPTGTVEINGVVVKLDIKTVQQAWNQNRLTDKQKAEMSPILETLNKGNTTAITKMWKDLIKAVPGGKNVEVLGYSKLIDFDLPDNIPAEGVKITLADSKITADMDMAVLHLKDNGEWEYISAEAGNGTLTFTVKSASPFYYFEDNTSVASSAPTASGTASPKTADSNMVLYVTMLAVVAVGCAVYGTRKVKVNR